MAWAALHKVILGSFAFLVFWTLATFPTLRFLPIGRTAGALLGGILMVVFQVLSPSEAFASIDLPILGLLFGTMVISVYLERAGLFKYLKIVLSWKCRGPKDLLCRVCIFTAIASAIFTNDTICVVFTEFVLLLCKQKDLPPLPFLIALATSANIGSAATPIGNPQNLVIAIESKITFGKFLLGVLPAVVVGIFLNIVMLLAFYWKTLNMGWDGKGRKDVLASYAQDYVANDQVAEHKVEKIGMYDSPVRSDQPDGTAQNAKDLKDLEKAICSPISRTPYKKAPQIMSPTSAPYSPIYPETADRRQIYSPRITSPPPSQPQSTTGSPRATPDHHLHHHSRIKSPSIMSPNIERIAEEGAYEAKGDSVSLHQRMRMDPPALNNEGEEEVVEEKPMQKFKRRLWTTCVYGVTLGFLVALLSGLNLTWSALTAAVALMVLDFSDAGPSLDRVSYALLVFFSGMFITVDGFNKTGAPGALWKAVEPHTRINSVGGVAILSLVVLILSNVASNVPTVLLLGTRVALTAAMTRGASVTKAWLYLAWVSTVAGNFTLIGSAANLIVCEQARQAQPYNYTLTFWAHLVFGIPSTLLVTAIGLPLIQG